MANIESNTLLEKLTLINSIKNQIRQALIDVGGGDYINEESPFSDFPTIITTINSDIKNFCALLETILYGKDVKENVINKDNLTFSSLTPYLLELFAIKSLIVDNLRVKGIECSTDEPFDSIANKLLKIDNSENKEIANKEIVDDTDIVDIVKLDEYQTLIFKIDEDNNVLNAHVDIIDNEDNKPLVIKVSDEHASITLSSKFGFSYNLEDENIKQLFENKDKSVIFEYIDKSTDTKSITNISDNLEITSQFYKCDRLNTIYLETTVRNILEDIQIGKYCFSYKYNVSDDIVEYIDTVSCNIEQTGTRLISLPIILTNIASDEQLKNAWNSIYLKSMNNIEFEENKS